MVSARPPITAAHWRRFAGDAVVWLLPAILLSPIYLAVLAISLLAEDGGLLQPFFEKRRGFHGALGVLLVGAAIAVAVVGGLAASAATDFVEVSFAVLITGGLGAYLCHRELRRLADRAVGGAEPEDGVDA